jgi:hypothetical protein
VLATQLLTKTFKRFLGLGKIGFYGFCLKLDVLFGNLKFSGTFACFSSVYGCPSLDGSGILLFRCCQRAKDTAYSRIGF